MNDEGTAHGAGAPTRSRWFIAAALLIVILAAAATGGYVWYAPAPMLNEPAAVVIEPGDSMRVVAEKLASARVVRSALAIRLYASMSGDARRIQPGDYSFVGGEWMADVMRHLVRGDIVVVTVTIPEGLTLRQIAERLEATGLVCADGFEREAREGRLVGALGLGPLGAEGYLFPATYRFSPRADSGEILAAMLGRFYRTLTPAVEQRMFDLGLSDRELVTLASIIEREAKVEDDRPLIAGVFYNRLALGIPLQADPTAEYALDGDRKLSTADAVRIPSTFNTYAFAGLPPGPIANPGMQSIEAALYPAKTKYLYFVARDDGTHLFSRSFAEHQRAIAELKRLAARASTHKAADSKRAE
ncbi:MAG: endolytic transglycosylase MltG [Candidatus Binataceae bacterium]